jgi:hypothetical protein
VRMTREELMRERAELVPDRVVMRRPKKRRGHKGAGVQPVPCAYDPATALVDCRNWPR